jgi:pimeloyl-ACP methyl ester carboxylesterase
VAMKEGSFLGLDSRGFHRIAYTQWGREDSSRTLICVHGLSGNGRHFDELAATLEDRYRVVCPDLAGRGRSDWLADPQDYDFPGILNDLTALIARLGVDSVDWVGTSLGGIAGMMLAARRNSPIRRLVLNDIGPQVPKAILNDLAAFAADNPVFADTGAAEQYIRRRWVDNGPYSDGDWRHLTAHGVRRDGEGRLRLHHDPAIGAPFHRVFEADSDWWEEWDAIDCPVLVLRGAKSDTLLADTVERMARDGPRARVVEIPGIGHCPGLRDAMQMDMVRRFLVAGRE